MVSPGWSSRTARTPPTSIWPTTTASFRRKRLRSVGRSPQRSSRSIRCLPSLTALRHVTSSTWQPWSTGGGCHTCADGRTRRTPGSAPNCSRINSTASTACQHRTSASRRRNEPGSVAWCESGNSSSASRPAAGLRRGAAAGRRCRRVDPVAACRSVDLATSHTTHGGEADDRAEAAYSIERDVAPAGPRRQQDAEQALEAVLASVLIRLAAQEATAHAA